MLSVVIIGMVLALLLALPPLIHWQRAQERLNRRLDELRRLR